MENIQQAQDPIKEQGVTTTAEEPILTETDAWAANPAANNEPAQPTAVEPTEQAATQESASKSMSDEQFELYKETLRRVSKDARTEQNALYNAFEDAEVKNLVKEQILAGEQPDAKGIAAAVIARVAPKAAAPQPETTTTNNEIAELKAELALVKAGIIPERLEAAKKLFLSEGADPGKAGEFVARYPEWKTGASTGGVVITKAPPVAGKTAPSPSNIPVLNDFEKKTNAARIERGLPPFVK